jgi:DNA-binding transcriptional ArsR family regulator
LSKRARHDVLDKLGRRLRRDALRQAQRDGLDVVRRRVYYTIRLINEMVSNAPPDRLSTTLAALADPTRRAILARLAAGESSVTELAKPFRMSLPAVSKHLKVLERAGLIVRGRSAQWRPCRLDAGPIREVAEWVADYRRFWDQSFERLDDYLVELQAKENERDRTS